MKLYEDKQGRRVSIGILDKFNLCPSVYRYPFWSIHILGLQLIVDMNKISKPMENEL